MHKKTVSVNAFWAVIIFFCSICRSGPIDKCAGFQQSSFLNLKINNAKEGIAFKQRTCSQKKNHEFLQRVPKVIIECSRLAASQMECVPLTDGHGSGGGGNRNVHWRKGGGGGGGGENEGGHGGTEGLILLLMPLVLLLRQYAGLLESAPLLTKALSAACIGATGDFFCQLWEHFSDKRHHERRTQRPFPLKFLMDRKRTLAVIFDGVVLTGPGLHLAYGIMEYLIPTGSGGALPALLHVCADTFFLDPMFVCTFFITTGTLERKSLLKDIFPQIRREYFSALHASWAVSALFMPIQYASFRYLPIQYRVLVVNAIDLAWTATMSFFSHKEPSVPESIGSITCIKPL